LFQYTARAETLADALASAYETNPTLELQRSQLKITDEAYVRARAGLRPTASISASAQYQQEDFGAGGGAFQTASGSLVLSPGAGTSITNAGGAQVVITQPLYTGGRTTAAIRAAEATIDAGREDLRAAESGVLFAAIQAYLDVMRDQGIAEIRRKNVEVLVGQLNLTQGRFEVGELTRTDLAEAEAQLAAARALLTSARAQLEISSAAYQAVIGRPPGTLERPSTLPGLPKTIDAALDRATSDNPTLRKAMATEAASRQMVIEAKAANQPSVSVQGAYGYQGLVQPLLPRDYDRAISATVTISQPIFAGGVNHSNIRVAIEQNNSDQIRIEIVRRQIVQDLAQAWSGMTSSQANEVSGREQVRSASLAFEGAQEEYKVGKRTTVDVLVAQEKLRDAELSLVQASHDAYVSQADVLRVAGRLEAVSLLRGLELYDPAKSFNHVKNAGAVPWEGAIAAIDGLGAARPEPHMRTTPPTPGPVTLAPAE